MSGCDFIYFDAGFTLLRPYPGVGHWYAEEARRFGVDVQAPELDKAFVKAWRENRSLSSAKSALAYGETLEQAEAFWTPVVRLSFEIAGYRPPADPGYYHEVFNLFATAKCWALYEDALETLDWVRSKGIGTGILSNWDARLRPVVEEMGLMDRLDAFLISADVGAEKPSPEIFARAREAAGLSPTATIGYIGDEPEADGFGPLRAGWRQCLVWRREDKQPPEDLQFEATLLGAAKSLIET